MTRVTRAKLRHYRSFAKFLGLHAVSVFVVVYIASRFTDVSLQGNQLPIATMMTRPQAWATVSALTRWLYFIPAFFAVQLVCAELELKLVRAQVIAGLSRRDVVAGWLLQNGVLAGASAVAVVVSVLAFAAPAAPGAEGGLAASILPEVGYLLYGVAFLNGAVLCAVLLRRPVPALVLLLAWPLAIEPSVAFTLTHYGADSWNRFLPFACLGTLTPWPGATLLDLTAPTALVAVVYGCSALALTWLRLDKLDL